MPYAIDKTPIIKCLFTNFKSRFQGLGAKIIKMQLARTYNKTPKIWLKIL